MSILKSTPYDTLRIAGVSSLFEKISFAGRSNLKLAGSDSLLALELYQIQLSTLRESFSLLPANFLTF